MQIYTKRFRNELFPSSVDLCRLNEHKSNENSALFRHSFLTDHEINYSNPKILATDDNFFRLQIKETLKIKELRAYKSLNGNRFVQAEPVVIILCNPTKSV